MADWNLAQPNQINYPSPKKKRNILFWSEYYYTNHFLSGGLLWHQPLPYWGPIPISLSDDLLSYQPCLQWTYTGIIP